MINKLLDKVNNAHLVNHIDAPYLLPRVDLCRQLVVKNHKSYLTSTNIERNIRVQYIDNTIGIATIQQNIDDCYDEVFSDCKYIKKILIDVVRLEKKEQALANSVRINDVYNFLDYDTVVFKREDKHTYLVDFTLVSVLSISREQRFEENSYRYLLFTDKMIKMLENVDINVKSSTDLQIQQKSLYFVLFSCQTSIEVV